MTLALITGATSGIGRELALEFAKKGIPLIVVGRDETRLENLALQIKTPITPLRLDLSREEERKRLLKLIEERVPDLVINNAGFGLYGVAVDLSLEEQKQMVEVNITAPLEITLTTAYSLKKNKKAGVIVNVSSIAGDIPTPLMSVYGATKAFLTSFSKGLDEEMRESKIRVLAALPGQVATEFATRAAKREIKDKNPFTMSVERAASEILWQIERKKWVHRFDFANRLLAFTARFLFPDRLIAKCVKMSLQKRL